MVCNSLIFSTQQLPTTQLSKKIPSFLYMIVQQTVVHTKVVEKALLSLLVISYESLQKMPLCCKTFIAADALQKHRFSPQIYDSHLEMNSPLSSIALYLLYTVNKIDFKKWLIHNLVLFIFIFILEPIKKLDLELRNSRARGRNESRK